MTDFRPTPPRIRAQRRGAFEVEPELCIERKKSDDGSRIITSLFLLKLCL
jgi:hypothetical protein